MNNKIKDILKKGAKQTGGYVGGIILKEILEKKSEPITAEFQISKITSEGSKKPLERGDSNSKGDGLPDH